MVVHPINPTNNLCATCAFQDWDRLAVEATGQLDVLRWGSPQDVRRSALGRAAAQVWEDSLPY